MRFEDFEQLVHRLVSEVPEQFLAGLQGIKVSRKTMPDPTRSEVYTLGECIPLPTAEGETGSSGIQSRVVLYHGSFRALAAVAGPFDWREEAWETLTHELRHHLEWRAGALDLEAFDWAAEQNFARGDGTPFDVAFHRAGERVAEGVYRIDDDFFLDMPVPDVPATLQVRWHGAEYTVVPPAGVTLPAFLTVTGLREPPPGDLVLVLHSPTGLRQLFRRRRAPFLGSVEARPLQAAGGLSSPGGSDPARTRTS